MALLVPLRPAGVGTRAAEDVRRASGPLARKRRPRPARGEPGYRGPETDDETVRAVLWVYRSGDPGEAAGAEIETGGG